MQESLSKVLRIGIVSEIRGLDPRSSQAMESMFVLRQIVDAAFLERVAGADPEPVLFEGPLENESRDGVALFRGRLKKGVRFADGALLTATDLAAAMTDASVIREHSEVRAENDTLLFTLKKPNARFDIVLSHIEGAPIRKGPRGELYGTGPFYLAADSTPKLLRLPKNPHYAGQVALDEVQFHYYPMESDGKADRLRKAFENGELDLCTAVPRDEISRLSGVRKSFLPGFSTTVLYLNTQAQGLRDKRVRQAIGWALDRRALADICYENSLAYAAASLLPRGMYSISDGFRYDLEKARTMLAQDGVEKPRELKLLLVWGPRPYLPQPEAVAQVLQQQILGLGIEVKIERSATSDEYFRKAVAGDFDMVLSGWAADTTDVCDFLEPIVGSDRIPSPTNLAVSSNYSQYRNPAVDQLLATYRGERRPEMLTELFDILREDVPVIPLIYGSTATVTSFRVQSFRPSPLSAFRVDDLDLRL